MILRYKVGFMEHIVDAEKVEIENASEALIKDGKWIFKDDPSICEICPDKDSCDGYEGSNTYSVEVTE